MLSTIVAFFSRTTAPRHFAIRNSIIRPSQSFSILQFASAKTTTVAHLPCIASYVARPLLERHLPRNSQHHYPTTVAPSPLGVAIGIAEAVLGALEGELSSTAVNAPMIPPMAE
ncbi:hypothetical protein HN51_013025 [Arachis hypogaea]